VHAEEEAASVPGHGVLISSEVKIALGDDVKFDGFGLKTRLTGAITAVDEPGRPTRGLGEFRLDGGRYKAYGQDLSIETGRLIFAGGPVTDPAIDITAVRNLGDLSSDTTQHTTDQRKVGLHARGTLAAPEFSLFSEPTMPQEEQLAWLVLGHPLSSTADSSQRTQISGAAVSLGLTGGEYLAQRLAPRLGLDEVSIASKPGESTDLARFTIGKYLSPRLFVSYGFGLFQPGNFFRMQYDLNKHIKLVGETGLEQGGDVLYTIER
jgi:translocation and assembly module TamB